MPSSSYSVWSFPWYDKYSKYITSVVFEEGITSIPEQICYNYPKLSSVSFADSIEKIGSSSFYGCPLLKSAVLPASLTDLGYSVFSSYRLLSISVSPENTTYDSRNDCNAVIRTSSNTLVLGCRNTVVPDTVETIATEAFQGCRGIFSVELPASVKSLDDMAYQDTMDLCLMHFPASVNYIGGDMYDASSLTDIIFDHTPADPITIATYAFHIHSPEGVNIYVPDTSDINASIKSFFDELSTHNITVRYRPVSEAPVIKTYGDLAYKVVDGEVTICGFNHDEPTEVQIPEEIEGYPVTRISPYAFYQDNVSSLYIPSQVREFSATDLCWYESSLAAVDVAADSRYYSAKDGVLFNKDQTALLLYPRLKTSTDYQVPYTVETIGEKAFYYSGLASVSLLDSLKTIGTYAFSSCKYFTSIAIPSSVHAIAARAFMYCSDMRDIYFGHGSSDTLTIGEKAFYRGTSTNKETNIYVKDPDNVNSALVNHDWEGDSRTVTYQQYDLTYYDIEYVLNGGTNSEGNPSRYSSLETVTLNDASRTGYDFVGWYDNEGFAGEPLETVNGRSVTLYAKWQPHVYTVRFDGNEASEGAMSDLEDLEYGVSYDLPANGFVRPGYEFKGWNNSSDGSGISYDDKSAIASLSDVDGDTVVLYAQWQPISYAINYELNGGTNSENNPGTYTCESETIVFEKASRTGYVFDGWYGDDALTEKIDELQQGSTGDVTVHAKWSPISYSVIFEPNSEECADEAYPQSFTYDLPQLLLPAAFVWEDHHVIGWATEPEGEMVYEDNEEVCNLTSGDGDTVYLYAVWDVLESNLPVANIESGEVVKYTEIYLSTLNGGTFYTLNGDDPVALPDGSGDYMPGDNTYLFGEAIVIEEDTIIKAIGVEPGRKPSAVVTFIYTIDESFDYGTIDPLDYQEYHRLNMPEGLWTSEFEQITYDPHIKTYTQEDLRVYDGNILLSEGTDYTIKYANNTKAGTASLTITGKGNYTGKLTKNFEIYPRSVDGSYILTDKTAFVCNGNVQRPNVTSVDIDGIVLKKNKDYKVNYRHCLNAVESGEYYFEIEGIGNYSRTVKFFYHIIDDEGIIPISSCTVSGINDVTYTGEPIIQKPIVKDGDKILTEGEDADYTLYVIDTDINAGISHLQIEGKGKYYGVIIKAYKILPIKLTAKNTIVEGIPETETYSGVHELDLSLQCGDRYLGLGTDYEVSYNNNDKAGKATVTIKGIGNYTGSFTKTFKITKRSLSGAEVALHKEGEYTYVKGGVKPTPDITLDGRTLALNKDYTISYKNNTTVNDGSNEAKLPMMTIKGKGNYEGTITRNFLITKTYLNDEMATAPDRVYSVKANAWKSTPILTDVNGKKLKAGTDYEKTYEYAIDGSPVTETPQAGDIITVTVTGKGNYEGTASATYRIVEADLSKAKVTIPSQYYTGKEIRPSYDDIKVVLNKKQLDADEYEIVSYENNVAKGTAKVTIRGKGNCGGTKTATFKIVQKSLGITIKYNPNGATSGSMKDQIIYKNTKLSKNTFKRIVGGVSKEFLGFNTKWDGSGDWYQPGELFTYDPDKAGTFVILWAQWAEPITVDIGISPYDLNVTYIAEYIQHIREYFAELSASGEKKYVLHVEDAQGDADRQLAQVRSFIEKGYDGMIINPVKTYGSEAEELADTVLTSGIPAVYINRQLQDHEYTGKTYYVGVEPASVGTVQGELIYGLPEHGDTDGDGKLSYVMLVGDPENSDAKNRTEGCIRYLTDQGMDLEELYQGVAYWNSSMAKELTNTALDSYGDSIDMVICNNDTMALGAVEAIREYGLASGEVIYVVGIDGIDDAYAAIRKGDMAGTVIADAQDQAAAACGAIITLTDGGQLDERIIYVPFKAVTKANVDNYLN